MFTTSLAEKKTVSSCRFVFSIINPLHQTLFYSLFIYIIYHLLGLATVETAYAAYL